MDLRAGAPGGHEQAAGRAGASPVPILPAGMLMPWGAWHVPPCCRAWHTGAPCTPRGAQSKVSPVIPSKGSGTRQGWQRQPAALRGQDAAPCQDGSERGERPRRRQQHPGLKRNAAHGGPIPLRRGQPRCPSPSGHGAGDSGHQARMLPTCVGLYGPGPARAVLYHPGPHVLRLMPARHCSALGSPHSLGFRAG